MSVQENMMNMMQKQQEYKLFVGDLDENCNDAILKKAFENYGAKSAVVNKAKRKRYPSETQERFYGVVSLSTLEDCERAKNEMDQKIIMNNRIRVCIYRSYFDRINSDIHFKGTGSSIQPQDIKEAFSQFGQVFSVKLAQEKNGQPLNYGYLSFSDKEAREKCIKALVNNCLEIKGHKVEVSQFLPSNQREKNHTNIYMKNLPGKSEKWNEESIKTFLQNEAKKYGEVLSMMVKFDERHQKHFAFICYKNTECAKSAYKAFPELEIEGQKVEVNWAQKKEERQQFNLQNMKMNVKKTNIFVKNLLETVEEEHLKEAFSQFGNITSAAVKLPVSVPTSIQNKTKFGFINFQNEQMAQQAMSAVQNPNTVSEQIKGLFMDGNVSIHFHKSRDQMNKQKSQKNGGYNAQNIMQMIQQFNNPQVFMQALQQMMFMNMSMLKNPKQNYQRNNMNMMNNMMKMPMMGGMPQQMQMQQQRGGQQQMQQMAGMAGIPQFGGMGQMMGGMGQFGQMGQMMGGMPMYATGMPNRSSMPSNVQAKVPVQEQQMTAQQLKENLNEFLKYDQDKQRSLLGSLLFPLVEKASGNGELAPKITGMLIDFDVFEVSEILEFLENEELLKERIKEAEDLIQNSGDDKADADEQK